MSPLFFIMKLFKLLIITILVLFSALAEGQSYPEWFLYPSRYPGLVTGFGTENNPAVINAENTYTAYESCVAYGTLYRFQSMDEISSEYFYYYSPDSLKKNKDTLFPVHKSHKTLNMITRDYIQAFSKKPDLQIESQKIEMRTLAKPEWINRLPFYLKNGNCYGIGQFSSRYNKADAWQKAEEKAIFNIMTSLAVQFHTVNIIEKTEKYETSENVKAMKVRYWLRNIQVMERWMDNNKNLVYVLVKIPRKDIISPMLTE